MFFFIRLWDDDMDNLVMLGFEPILVQVVEERFWFSREGDARFHDDKEVHGRIELTESDRQQVQLVIEQNRIMDADVGSRGGGYVVVSSMKAFL